jgi:exonuclease III
VSFQSFIFADTECPFIKNTHLNKYTNTNINKNKIRIVQYNVEWLFIDYYSAMDCPGEGCSWKNETDAYTHMDYVAEVINDLEPDIINLCEVEGCDELNILNEKLYNNYSTYLKKGTDTSTGQNVGLLTRIEPVINLYRNEDRYEYPISGSECGYTGSSGTSGVSKHYITEFKLGNMDVAFISAHLVAIPTDPARCAQREAQAAVLQSIISNYIANNYEIIMIGDFNDYDAEVLDLNNNKPTSKVLDILKGNIPLYASGYTLYSVAETILQCDRYSDWWDSDNNCNTTSAKDYSMIDHILVTDSIRQHIVDSFIYHAYKEYCGKYNSDHYPLVIDISL